MKKITLAQPPRPSLKNPSGGRAISLARRAGPLARREPHAHRRSARAKKMSTHFYYSQFYVCSARATAAAAGGARERDGAPRHVLVPRSMNTATAKGAVRRASGSAVRLSRSRPRPIPNSPARSFRVISNLAYRERDFAGRNLQINPLRNNNTVRRFDVWAHGSYLKLGPKSEFVNLRHISVIGSSNCACAKLPSFASTSSGGNRL
ncbi:hypothetical protein EVAR_6415_1 [Eumeta japonica]|uniref:Uncharacterized protein n=1 Tax=Eumeta variegata TaxID=151549 RepID=A0A4C1TDP9_EUMVA|nr:hypothetical protein EVAR_6415_1 [Eumeta japonica]